MFSFLLQRKRKGEGEGDTFRPLVHFPNEHNCQRWSKPKLGATNSIQILLVGGRGPSTHDILCYLLDTLAAGSWINIQDSKTCSSMGCEHYMWWLSSLGHNTSHQITSYFLWLGSFMLCIFPSLFMRPSLPNFIPTFIHRNYILSLPNSTLRQ